MNNPFKVSQTNMHSPASTLLCIALVLTPFCSCPAQTIDPFGGHAQAFHANLTRYFASEDAEKVSRANLQIQTVAFTRDAGWQPNGAAERLKNAAGLLTAWMRHEVYCEARAADDTQDKDARNCEHDAASHITDVSAFVDTQLRSQAFTSLRPDDLERLGLGPFAYLIAQSRDGEQHSLTPEISRAVTLITVPLGDGWTDRYFDTVRRLKASPVQTANGTLDPIKDAAKIAQDPNRSVREAGFDALQEAYNTHAELFAATLIDTVREETALAKLRSYPSAPARMYAARLQLSEAQVQSTLHSISQGADVFRQYQRVRAERVAAATGLQDVRSWDMALSSGYTPKVMTFDEGKRVILAALKPLGAEYTDQFSWLLNSQNGALDIAGGTNRQLGGFSLGFPGVPAMLYVDQYDGSLASTAVVIHEGGHAIHRKLMSDAGVSPFYASGPKFLMEAYAILNELLLWDELERESSSPAERAYFEERLLDKVTFEVFTSAEEAALEQGLYDGVSAGTINTAADIDSLNGRILAQYELFASEEPQLRTTWMRKRLLYEDPLYLVNYLYAALVACKLYEMDKADSIDFQKRYMTLLREGFDAPAAELIKRNMGFTLNESALLSGAMDLIRQHTAKLQQIYASER